MSGTNTLLTQGSGAGAGFGYVAICGATYVGISTESQVQSVIQSAATFSHMGAAYQSQFGATPLLFRKNTASGNQTVTFATNADSYFFDSTHSDTVTAGDSINLWQNNTAAILTPRFGNIQCNASTPLCMYGCGVTSPSGNTFSATTHYSIVQGATGGSVAAANNSSKGSLQAAGTLSNLGMSIITAPTGAVTVSANVNGSSGNQALSFSSGTGYKQDTTHTDAITAGADVCTSYSCANSTGVWMTAQYQFAGTTSAFDAGLGNDAGMAPPATPYFGLGGFGYWGSATETEVSTGVQFAVTASLLRLRSTQGNSSSLTAFLRIATANGNETLVLSAQSGLVTDSTHTDAITAGQLVDYSLSTNSNLASVFITMNDGSVGGAKFPSLSVTGSGP